MRYFNQKVYKKSYLLEYRMNGSIESVAFSVPPQSEEFTYPQRIGETKTFGGTVFEDYGNDSVKITLTGNTVNSELRLVYKGSNGDSTVNGEEEIFLIKDLIEKYGKIDSLKGKEVFLYSLSGKEHKWWRVVVNNFQIKRSKDAPFTYNYTLQCTSVPNSGKKFSISSKFSAPTWVTQFTGIINSCCNEIQEACGYLKEGLETFRTGIDLISTLESSLDPLKSSVNQFYSLLNGYVATVGDYVDSSASLIKETLNLGKDTIYGGIRVVVGGVNDIYSQAANILEHANDVVDFFQNLKLDQIGTSVESLYGDTSENIKNTWLKLVNNIQGSANTIEKETKKTANTIDYSVIPGSENENDIVIATYGFTEKTIEDGDTWDSLAKKYYGVSELGSVIAIYNGTNNNELKTGTTIAIPNISPINNNSQNNEVYNTPDVKDNYGRDILISENGDFLISQNDLVTVGGSKNLGQAINSRLRSSIENRIRLNTYGIRSSIGSAAEIESYIISSIQETLSEEPRIKSVENIKFTGIGDDLNVQIFYTDINNKSQVYGGTY